MRRKDTQACWEPDQIVDRSEDESRILTVSADFTSRIWDASTGDELARLPHDDRTSTGLWNTLLVGSWNRDETRILTRSHAGRTLRVWDGNSGEKVGRLKHDEMVASAIWSNDESRILTGSVDGTARVWDGDTGMELARLQHDGHVSSATWSQDESLVLTQSDDGTVRIWDAITGVELTRLQHNDSVSSALWSKDESRVLTSSIDNAARFWTLSMSGLQLKACRLVGNNWTIEKWGQYMDGPYTPTCPNIWIPPQCR